MIEYKNGIFFLTTETTSYIFRVLETGQLENLHYGVRLPDQDFTALHTKITAGIGTTVAYGKENPDFSLDRITFEYSGIGKGDFRHTPMEIKMPDGTWVTDFVYTTHTITDGNVPVDGLPSSRGGSREDETCRTLTIALKDRKLDVDLLLFYTVYPAVNVIARRTALLNNEKEPLVIRKLMSMMLDLPECGYDLVTFDGGWIKEAHRHIRPLSPGIYVNDSTTGNSSNRHNPGIILSRKGASEDRGECIGINLIYSGNHYEAVEISGHDMLRVMTGINPHCFEWELSSGMRFDTPEAVLSFSEEGFNGLSRNMHQFVNAHIVRGPYKGADRPVLFNNWEAHFFDYNKRKIVKLAREARSLGAELFVLDDGWFGDRNSDTSGLGDYRVNTKKLPGGLKSLSRKITKMGMRFGLWFEPEMVNEDSDLYRAHPDWAVRVPGREPSPGRNQLVLDLCRREVRDYIVENVNTVLKSAEISYVKWDMNRHITDMYSPAVRRQGEFFHRYILGLYDILSRITSANPDILFESCASGGNRFDLGMLCYMPQIWASDNTDPVERLKIQAGLSYLYPLSAIGAHVPASPHQQTLRNTPLSTRFNVSAFGLLGYELDPGDLSPAEKKEIRAQIAFYKRHRITLQYGRFFRFDTEKGNMVDWQALSTDGREAVRGRFQTLAEASPPSEILRFKGLNDRTRYDVETVPQTLSIRSFGALIRHAAGKVRFPGSGRVFRALKIPPFKPRFRPDGCIVRTIDRYYRLKNGVEKYTAFGDVLRRGIKINQQFMGTWYNQNTRLLSDFGSNLFIVKAAREADSPGFGE